ncbi:MULTISPECIES: MAB_1171c family putative transporter [unclassified Streptomyces]|uniref:MAB_1171c family putative transporter n=1 Tax=unclassified Streptomyces TaxID=2593676 RepID=UPI0033BA3379
MNGLIYYLAAGVLWMGLAAQLPDLRRHRRDPLKRSFCAVILLSGLCFVLGAPPTVILVNRLTGIPNMAAPLTYGAVTAFGAASLILIVHWRGSDPVQVRRTSRAWLFSYLGVIAAEGVLFSLGNAPVERRADFDTYYATTPFIREMIVLYLMAHMVAAVTTTLLCWSWIRKVKRWTRGSLALLVLGWLFTSAYGIVKCVALTAHWLGHRWDTLSTSVAPLVAVGSCLASAGYILPLVGPRIDSAVTFVRLRPLFRLLAAPTSRRRCVTALSWRMIGDVELRLTTRETAIRDGLKRLSGQLDDQVRSRAYRDALAAGSSAAEAEVIGLAAMVAVAALADAPTPMAETGTIGISVGDVDVIVSVSARVRRPAGASRSLDTGQPSLLSLSKAVRTPIVDAAIQSRRTAVRQLS